MIIKYPLLIDGGLSNELEKRGHNLNHKLWSAKLLESEPEAIIEAHLAYLEAGAQCITTSSYQASIPGFMSIGYDMVTAESLIKKSVHLAEKAIKRFHVKGIKPMIAASIGPYGAYLADGSEYHGNYGVSEETLREFHEHRIKLLDHSNADILACETIPSFKETLVLANILKKVEKQAWVSFSCKDEYHLNDGTLIEDCIDILTDHPKIFAIGVNCTAPEYISGLIKTLKARIKYKRIIVYPNSGEVYNAKSKTWSGLLTRASFLELTKEWINLGADIIGGCCRIGPEEIKSISELIKV